MSNPQYTQSTSSNTNEALNPNPNRNKSLIPQQSIQSTASASSNTVQRDPSGKPIIFSQPTDTGVGRHWATQLVYAVNFLKAHAAPIRLDDLAIMSGVDALAQNSELLLTFQNHEKVVYDERTDLYSYKPDFILNTPADLLSILRRYAPRGGLTVKTLRASWPGVNLAIEELEKQGKVLVSRTLGAGERNGFGGNGNALTSVAAEDVKEGQMKAVFLDEVGNEGKVDVEFRDLWNSLKTPIADELAEELRSAGLNAASSIPLSSSINNNKKGKKGKGNNNRKLKITNTHLKEFGIDLSKDYVGTGRRG